jgi:hypothetical protein
MGETTLIGEKGLEVGERPEGCEVQDGRWDEERRTKECGRRNGRARGDVAGGLGPVGRSRTKGNGKKERAMGKSNAEKKEKRMRNRNGSKENYEEGTRETAMRRRGGRKANDKTKRMKKTNRIARECTKGTSGRRKAEQ